MLPSDLLQGRSHVFPEAGQLVIDVVCLLLNKNLDYLVLRSPFEIFGGPRICGFAHSFRYARETRKIHGRFVNAVYTVSLLRSRKHQVYVQDAKQMVSDAFTPGICSQTNNKQGLQ